jgi:N-acetylglucosaminyldiphosphoundecaprenol N-acetyl-beta-D-mannosaminyltransferase
LKKAKNLFCDKQANGFPILPKNRFFIGKRMFNRYNEFMNTISILGVKISNLDGEKSLVKAKEFLADGQQHFIVTPNPEIVLNADRDEELFYILNSADLSLGDGFGLKIASWFNGQNLKRVSGADFSDNLLTLAVNEKIKVGALIWKNGLSKKADLEKALQKKYPQLDFIVESVGRESGSALSANFLAFEPRIVLVGFGSPWQEKFIFHNLKNIPSANIMIGVGGTLDFMTGRRRRAPKFIRVIGLEWLWRFLFSPQVVGQKRSKRIWDAVVCFPCEFFKRKFINSLLYRPNVVCLLYKRELDKYKILIVERQNEPGHWQLPQGGTDGQNLLVAGARELSGEINTNKFITKRVFKSVYRYKFSVQSAEINSKAAASYRHSGYKGQSQGLYIAEFTGRDEDIKINFWDHSAWIWVDSEKLVDSVHLIRKRSTQRFLKRFKEFVKQK